MKPLIIHVTNPESRYVALDIKDRSKVVSEGRTLQEARERAGDVPVSLMWIGEPGKTYVFGAVVRKYGPANLTGGAEC